jgi:hypothetical protein
MSLDKSVSSADLLRDGECGGDEIAGGDKADSFSEGPWTSSSVMKLGTVL